MRCTLCQNADLDESGNCRACGAESCPECNRAVMMGETCECGLDALYCEHCGVRVASGATCRCGHDPATGEPAEIVKLCACGRGFGENDWDALPAPSRGGEQYLADSHEVLSFRNCRCGTTLTRVHCGLCGDETHGHEHTCEPISEALDAIALRDEQLFERALERIATANT